MDDGDENESYDEDYEKNKQKISVSEVMLLK